MKRKFRILRLWLNGRLHLAKRVHHRIVISKLLEYAKKKAEVEDYWDFASFHNALNEAQLKVMEDFCKRDPNWVFKG